MPTWTPADFLIVRLEPGLELSRRVGLYHNIVLLPGVLSATDGYMAGLTPEEVDHLIGLPSKAPKKPLKKPEPHTP